MKESDARMALGLRPPPDADEFLPETLQNADWARVKAQLQKDKQKDPYFGWTETMLKKEKKRLQGKKEGKAANSLERVNQELQGIEDEKQWRIKVQEDVAEAMKKRAGEKGAE